MTRATYNLNPISIPLLFLSPMLLSVLLAAALAASPRLHAAEAGYSAPKPGLTVDCDERYISQRKASWLLGADNFSQTYAKRAALYAKVARGCASGVAAVRLEGGQATTAVAQLPGR